MRNREDIMRITSAKFVKGVIGTDDILYDGLPQIVFVGRSNVGKSSVINSLTNQKGLVKVGKKPGKTTEINFFLINKKFYFVDLPGYGYAHLSPAKREKIRKRMLWYLLESKVKATHVVIVLDIKAGFTDFDAEMAYMLKEAGHHYIIIANKIDKLNRKEISRQLAFIRENSHADDVIPYSTVTKESTEAVLKILFGGV